MIKKIFKTVLILGLLLFIFVLIFTFTVIGNTPKIDPLKIYDYLAESSTLYDDSGNVIDNLYLTDGNRTNIDYEDMPENLINAIVSIEDKTFWKHHGFNFWRMGGAVKEYLEGGGQISGTSTITQQLARNVYLSESKSVRSLGRKVSEAYYTVLLENSLSKKKIIEAYLNTISFGYNAYGVQSAARAYFGKDAKDLDLAECAALAAIPKASSSYALVTKLNNAQDTNYRKQGVASRTIGQIIHKGEDYTYIYNGDRSADRRKTVLNLMVKQGYISQNQAEEAKNVNLADRIVINTAKVDDSTTYFIDYLIEDLKKDLMNKYNYSKRDAEQKIYAGGLKVHTTLNAKAQQAIEKGFAQDYNFPDMENIQYDHRHNIVNDKGKILMYSYNNLFTHSGQFRLAPRDYSLHDGNLVLKKGRKLKFMRTNVRNSIDYSIEFRKIYNRQEGKFYAIDGGFILVPQKYKSIDDKGNLVINKKFLRKFSSSVKKINGYYYFASSLYSLKTKAQQPQAAMAILDYRTGQVKAIMGGRNIKGQKLFNRATSPRQPGSAIKPLSVYSSALQQGKEAADKGIPMRFITYDKNQRTGLYGSYWTASSGINDAPLTINGKVWPKNWYNGYRGVMSLRKSVEQSVNVNAVRVFQQVGPKYAIRQLKKFGVSTLANSGIVSDDNAAALALGGMVRGISPLEMANAYGTFPNRGVRIEPVTYTKVEDKNNNEILYPEIHRTQVISHSIAFIMQDILRTTVENGIAKPAKIPGVDTAGKTGTTSDKKDIWFCGFTPHYTAALWIGNDINLSLSSGSEATAKLWSLIMKEAVEDLYGNFESMPDGVLRIGGEYYATGTESGRGYYMPVTNAQPSPSRKPEEDELEEDPDIDENDIPSEDEDIPEEDGE